MNLGSKRALHYVLGIALAFFICIPLAQGQAAPATGPKPQMAEDVFKNVQLLKGIPVKEFMDTMGFFSASTGLNCIDCHSPDAADSLAAYAIDTPLKQTARKMIIMVNMLDKSNFGGQRKVTCYTCHRATDHPEAIPSLLDQYSVEPDDPDRVEVIEKGGAPPVNQLSADKVLDKYIQAIGGAAQVAKLTSFVGKGTYEGFDTYSEKVPFEIFAKAPDQLTTVIHTQHGDSVSHLRRHSRLDRCVGQIDARPPACRRRPRGRQDGRFSLVSRADQARVQVAHRLPFGLHRRQTSRSDSGRRGRRHRRQIIFRQAVGDSLAAGAL